MRSSASALSLVRNVRLLVAASAEHLVDDPAFFAVQVSRRLPFRARMAVSSGLDRIGRASGAVPVRALASYLSGRASAAADAFGSEIGPRPLGPLSAEVAVLVGRHDVVGVGERASTYARSLWARGRLSAAVAHLESRGQGSTNYARRLRSELHLLQPGRSLPAPSGGANRDEQAAPVSRVLHIVTNSLPHTQSGYSLRTHRILTSLNGAGIDSRAITRTGYPVMLGKPFAKGVDIVDGLQYHRVLPSKLGKLQEDRLLQQVRAATALAEEFRPQILHTTTNYLNALVAQAVSRATGIPWVFEVRGLMEQTWVASKATVEEQAAAAASERAQRIMAREAELANAADWVVTLSETMREELVRRGVVGDRITVIPNGVDDKVFTRRKSIAAARSELGLDADALMIGAVSALVDYEGFDVLIRALAAIVADSRISTDIRDRLRVTLVGDGAARPGIRTLAEELGVADRVLLPGKVLPEEAQCWVSALDLVVVPRRDQQVTRLVTPQKPVEALALERRVIISDLPALRETVNDALQVGDARAFTPGDPDDLAATVVSMLSEGRNVASSVEDRSWSFVASRYCEAYDSARSMSREVRERVK